jgi:hypothetical protein
MHDQRTKIGSRGKKIVSWWVVVVLSSRNGKNNPHGCVISSLWKDHEGDRRGTGGTGGTGRIFRENGKEITEGIGYSYFIYMNKVNLWILSESLREIFAPSFQSISGLPRIGVVRTWNKMVTHARTEWGGTDIQGPGDAVEGI